MENWEKRLEIITDGICFRQSDVKNAWWETSEGAKFGKLKLSEIKELFSSELELAKQEERERIEKLFREDLRMLEEPYLQENSPEMPPSISILSDGIVRCLGVVHSLHQNNNEQGGK